MFLRRPHRSSPILATVSALSCVVSSLALAGCSEDSDAPSDLGKAPVVFIDAVFTTEADSLQGIARPPERQPLGTVKLPCDGRLAVRLAYERWSHRAPGLCVQALNCGHAALELSLGELNSQTMVVSSPALFDLAADQPLWSGAATLTVELRKDDGSPFLIQDAPVRDEVEVPLSPRDCASP